MPRRWRGGRAGRRSRRRRARRARRGARSRSAALAPSRAPRSPARPTARRRPARRRARRCGRSWRSGRGAASAGRGSSGRGCAAGAAARRRASPASAPRPSPAVMTIAARVPSRPSSSISPGTVRGGVQITARSGGCGRSPTRAWHGYAVERRVLGIDREERPREVPARRLRQTVAPTLPARSEAPITATEPAPAGVEIADGHGRYAAVGAAGSAGRSGGRPGRRWARPADRTSLRPAVPRRRRSRGASGRRPESGWRPRPARAPLRAGDRGRRPPGRLGVGVVPLQAQRFAGGVQQHRAHEPQSECARIQTTVWRTQPGDAEGHNHRRQDPPVAVDPFEQGLHGSVCDMRTGTVIDASMPRSRRRAALGPARDARRLP